MPVSGGLFVMCFKPWVTVTLPQPILGALTEGGLAQRGLSSFLCGKVGSQ